MTALKETLTPESQGSDFSAFDNALRSLESIPLARSPGGWYALTASFWRASVARYDRAAVPHRKRQPHADRRAGVGFNRDITYLMPFKQPVGLMRARASSRKKKPTTS